MVDFEVLATGMARSPGRRPSGLINSCLQTAIDRVASSHEGKKGAEFLALLLPGGSRTQEVAKLIRSSIIETRLREAPPHLFLFRRLIVLSVPFYTCSTLLHSQFPLLFPPFGIRIYMMPNAGRKVEVENQLFMATISDNARIG